MAIHGTTLIKYRRCFPFYVSSLHTLRKCKICNCYLFPWDILDHRLDVSSQNHKLKNENYEMPAFKESSFSRLGKAWHLFLIGRCFGLFPDWQSLIHDFYCRPTGGWCRVVKVQVVLVNKHMHIWSDTGLTRVNHGGNCLNDSWTKEKLEETYWTTFLLTYWLKVFAK